MIKWSLLRLFRVASEFEELKLFGICRVALAFDKVNCQSAFRYFTISFISRWYITLHPSNHSSGSPHHQTGRKLVAIWLPHTSWMIDVQMHRWLVVTDYKDKDFLWIIQTFLQKKSYKAKIAPNCDTLVGHFTHDGSCRHFQLYSNIRKHSTNHR